MTNASILRLEAEQVRLRAVIEDSEKRLAELTTLISLMKAYGELLGNGPQPVSQLFLKLHGDLRARSTSLKARILGASEQILADGVRRFSRDLLPELAKRGVKIGGRDPAANLSSYLSREKDRFVSDPKAGGWTLRYLTQTQDALKAVGEALRAAESKNGNER